MTVNGKLSAHFDIIAILRGKTAAIYPNRKKLLKRENEFNNAKSKQKLKM